MCGGTVLSGGATLPALGLSPRVRGNRRSCGSPSWQWRSIPACAGEPGGPGFPPASSGVYPRVCGGTDRAPSRAGWYQGLSPRVRGNRGRHTIRRPGRGSIPACAGEPAGGPGRAALRGVYPRVCGGTQQRTLCRRRMGGLSPRVRGNRLALCQAAGWCGSIPACAGEPSGGGAVPSGGGVYPRVCGGTHPAAWHTIRRRGLSPRVRGNL